MHTPSLAPTRFALNLLRTTTLSAALAGITGFAHAQLDSLRCGHRLLGQATAAHGGEAALAAITRLNFRAEGPVRNAYQGFAARLWREPVPNGSQLIQMSLNFGNGLHVQHNVQRLVGGLELSFTTRNQGASVWTLRAAEQLAQRSPAPSAEAAAAQVIDLPSRLLPPLLLRRARENMASVRCQEEGDGLEFNWDARTRIMLVLDDQYRVAEARVPQPDPMDGDTLITWRYEGTQTVAGVHWPERSAILRHGVALMNLQLSQLRVNAEPSADEPMVPAGYAQRDDAGTLNLLKIAEGVWELRGIAGGNYRVPVFEASDHLVVFDAPLNSAVTRQLQAQLRRHLPGKPVRHVVLSHFHVDHAGGLPAWVEAGANVLLNPGDRPFVEQLLAARSLFTPTPGNATARLQTVTHDLTLADSGLQVRRVQGSPHVAEMLVLWHPASGTLAQADLFSTLTPFNPTYAHFAQWLERHAPEVGRVVGVHHDPMDTADLQRRAAAFAATR